MKVQCPFCLETYEQGPGGWLELRFELAWCDSSGSEPKAFSVEGPCIPCARKQFSELANRLRFAVGRDTVPTESEKVLKRAEFSHV